MRRRVPLLVAAAAALTFAAALGADDLPRDRDSWIEARTANFLIFSDATEGRTREYAADLEQLRAALAQLDPVLGAPAPCPTYLYVFKNRFALAPYLPRFAGKREELAGYFQPRRTANYMVMDGDSRGPGEQIVYHEYLHHLLHSRYAHLPLWLDEGLAEYFSTFHIADGEARLGLPIEEHIRWLRQNNLIPLQQLLATNHQSKDYHEGIQQGVFYAESWALTHYLLLGNPARRPQLAQMAKLIESGVPQEKAFAQAFGGDYSALDHELSVYVNRRLFNYERLPLQAATNQVVTVARLAAPDALYRLGDLLLQLGPDEQAAAAEHFRAALAANPRHALATAGLGEIEEDAHRPDAALAGYQKAVQLISQAPPADAAFLHYLLGRALHDRAADAGAVAVAELTAATNLAPDFGEGWVQLGLARLALTPPPPDTVAAFATAHRLLPTRLDVTLNYAIAAAAAGNRRQAEALLEQARLGGAPADQIGRARESLLYADYDEAAKQANAGNLPAAIAILERLAATAAPSGDFHRQVTDQLARMRDAYNRKRYIDAYNHAVELANRGDLKAAAAQLEALLAGNLPASAAPIAPTDTTAAPAAADGAAPLVTAALAPPPVDIADEARKLLDSIKAALAHHR